MGFPERYSALVEICRRLSAILKAVLDRRMIIKRVARQGVGTYISSQYRYVPLTRHYSQASKPFASDSAVRSFSNTVSSDRWVRGSYSFWDYASG